MENIAELKERCRKKHKKGVTQPHFWATLFARRVSIYITWLIVNYTNISANQVTLWQLTASLIGLGLLCFSNPWIALSGILFLHLGYIFDNVDGEVARYRKTQSINGMFLDLVNHDVIIPFVFGCTSFHVYFNTGNHLYFFIGMAFIMFDMNPVGKGRNSTIYFLIKKKDSPTYNVSNYRKNNSSNNAFLSQDKQQHGQSSFQKLKHLRDFLNSLSGYPNDLIIILLLILTEIIFGILLIKLFLIVLISYHIVNFFLSLNHHLRNRIPERDFRVFVDNCIQIHKDAKSKNEEK